MKKIIIISMLLVLGLSVTMAFADVIVDEGMVVKRTVVFVEDKDTGERVQTLNLQEFDPATFKTNITNCQRLIDGLLESMPDNWEQNVDALDLEIEMWMYYQELYDESIK